MAHMTMSPGGHTDSRALRWEWGYSQKNICPQLRLHVYVRPAIPVRGQYLSKSHIASVGL